ncbi:MAG: SGNH/GDSL hydrolase family protein [Negativicutes bacterium]
MKRFTFVVLVFALLLYILENTSIAGLHKYKPTLTADLVSNEYILSWPRIPYIAYYEVEVLSKPSDDAYNPSALQSIIKYRTWKNNITIDKNFPFRTYWRVSAQGLFQRPLGYYSDSINLSQIMGISAEDFYNIKPIPISNYDIDNPASEKSMLTWSKVEGAVSYEIEILSNPPENPNTTIPSRYRIHSTQQIFTNGYNANFSKYANPTAYWRVRALDYDGNPLGVYSDATEIYIEHNLNLPLKPLINSDINKDGRPAPLYPVYSWIPISGAVSYEVELTNAPPENPNSTNPSKFRIWSKEVVGSSNCYDNQPRITPGVYFWRVRGLDMFGNPVGVYSDAHQFTVDLSHGSYIATFGDSITHGGGAISYSPADWEYSYQIYLQFTATNLGRSGDTSESMVERFDRDVLPYQPKFLLILGGTNSLRSGTTALQVIKNLTVIREKCLINGIRPIFLTLPPINPTAIDRAFNEETAPNWREQFDLVNSFIRQQRYHIVLDPYFCNANRELPDHYAIDGLHPDIEGKKLIAQIINANWWRVTR